MAAFVVARDTALTADAARRAPGFTGPLFALAGRLLFGRVLRGLLRS